MKRVISIWTLLFGIFALMGCKNSQVEYDMPNVGISEFIYLNNPSNFDLTVQGGWVYRQSGLKGLIIYRRYFNFDANDFVAYERACPIHFNDDCGILKVENSSTLQCQCDQKEYVLFDGSPLNDNPSPSVKFYRTTFDGGNVIHVVN